MRPKPRALSLLRWTAALGAVCLGLSALTGAGGADVTTAAAPKDEYTSAVRPLLQKFCLSCHSTKVKKGDLDLERFTSIELMRKDLKPWQAMIEMLESGEMPPKKKPQPTADEHKHLLAWVRSFLNDEARARAGDPGPAAPAAAQ